ncbi:MAG: aspartate carbamoyltransferase regulatory subunit [Christensenellales bacterium]|jgi:aspartate carbamoyltransferase regulatory subunit
MNVDGIKSGIVLDHIQAGRSMQIYQYLHLDELDCSIAIIKNVRSTKMGRKDIIKIDAEMDINLDVLGYIDPNITVNIVRDYMIVDKKHLALPKKLKGVIRCKNPRCITSTEQEIEHEFYLSDEKKQAYRCNYCEASYKQ